MRKYISGKLISLDAATVNATDAYQRSDSYSQVPTSKIATALLAGGWEFAGGAAKAVRQTADDYEAKRGHAMHSLRFGHPSFSRTLGADPQIIVTNSHDGTSALRIELGLFRLVCSNGLVVQSARMLGATMRHVGLTIDMVQNAVTGILERAPEYVRSIEQWGARIMSNEEQIELARQSARVRWGVEASGVSETRLLATRRGEDWGADLWRVFNRVQEAVIQGGPIVRRFNETGALVSNRRAPSIRGVAESLRVNRELWQIAESFAA